MNIQKLLLLLPLGITACGAGGLTSEDPPDLVEQAESSEELIGATDCRALIRSQMDWLNAGGGNNVSYRMVSHETTRNDLVAVTDGHFSYVTFGFYFNGTYYPRALSSDPNYPNGTTAFSDRNRLCGGVYQPFDPTREDEIHMTIDENGRVRIVLRSWGNTVVNLEPSECKNGVMHAFGGNQLYSITFEQWWLG